MNLFHRPWLHFLVLGAALLALRGALFPEPRTVIGPLSEARISALQDQWSQTAGTWPSSEQTARLVAAALDRDMLFQRAVELGLHRRDGFVRQRLMQNLRFLELAPAASAELLQGPSAVPAREFPPAQSDEQLLRRALDLRLYLSDEVIKQRLVEEMKRRLLASNPPPEPSRAEVEAAFAARRGELAEPSRWSLAQVFFPDEESASTGIALIEGRGLDFPSARGLGAPFLSGHEFSRRTMDELLRVFGEDFARGLAEAQLTSGSWRGVLRSSYGLHYVWVTAYDAAQEPRFADVEVRLRRDLHSERQGEALRGAIAALRTRYDLRGIPESGGEAQPSLGADPGVRR